MHSTCGLWPQSTTTTSPRGRARPSQARQTYPRHLRPWICTWDSHNLQKCGRDLGFHTRPGEQASSKNGVAAVEWSETGWVLLIPIYTRDKVGFIIHGSKMGPVFTHALRATKRVHCPPFSYGFLFQSSVYIFRECYLYLYFLHLDKPESAITTDNRITKAAKA